MRMVANRSTLQAVPTRAAGPARSDGSVLAQGGRVNAMSIDVEEYFQVWAFEDVIDRETWGDLPSRLDICLERVCTLLAARNVTATFFVLGWIAERHPHWIRRLAAAGHEIASHGYDHRRVTDLSRDEFRADVDRTRKLLEDLSSSAVIGYRAPSYSINRERMWALDVLAQAGYRYSSSIYPVHHDLYGIPEAPRQPFRHSSSGLLEIPVTTAKLFGANVPCGGGGYFRFWPYRFSRWAIRRVNSVDGMPAVFYFHPWEVDAEQPHVERARLKSRFRHYLNLRRMEKRLARLLGDFSWDRMDRVFLLSGASQNARPWPDRLAANQ
jgi:polysaccharide deacetylase family protein (PEP-CTERM system associated)